MSAMLLDELMGRACAAAGTPGLTVSLRMRYHRPVPLETPLRILARVTGTDDRRIFVSGSITTQTDPVEQLGREGDGTHPGRRLRALVEEPTALQLAPEPGEQ
ncbi:PaaI family thioesterase [Streptomyces stelliscabiei]|uniref:PaaI family thioesterase n=1 Tax=Streptomyces stelliscabiei TaxID=146820 RepID=UPI0029BA6F7F|nr:hotdog domain-containing protein [Streptomyces stelliscabiei]MDX2552109.1 hotdog domain-containing protein [Streptomyces stelliscabiei]MDX2609523.1 hotdog domain-containing protein [Streptomyces stelliscabiei]MDX2636726.1 hotdog domain-containing protein [Streptomyces stelliscabiei]MDX2660158.1 hotdog domain-containing protein [Streptomyces stelliscabiei]MDX2710809.1 hotdog domain-containing protein [Streptomyces stelliscabiei]